MDLIASSICGADECAMDDRTAEVHCATLDPVEQPLDLWSVPLFSYRAINHGRHGRSSPGAPSA
ncbi:hypothetical protein BN2476_700007 [Paraburkholderia piptadeniae]|uniref:Uncharacterized protein n=1 Tax=Paraburkholderia piptadeniae TaxID=1701573 RepID=A0A1N7SQ95_9BURK|nr:hypothetical protein BN2476_700007 [Paraburkholderia piptadeniae]